MLKFGGSMAPWPRLLPKAWQNRTITTHLKQIAPTEQPKLKKRNNYFKMQDKKLPF